ncbi:hypothetical protein A11A3_00565 [Alcanivorax hongdengensis A-11-3]|uniref:DUF11 domain-containing protein n=1 Tax=Alcanivorax hongdengensis A-11-3 TaxID=1177179 RepID=L0WG16_9GAMM|nr:DUF11 domain-containing protein [Alcanivorax hongdengensis]EKF75941.1 hypothetical protein A11A3_00565 [Alcanivorax hongdengensis A-11-3]
MKSYLVVSNDGKEVFSEAKEAAPGDTIEYRLTYTNTSDQPLAGLVVTGPIPANTAYLKGSAHSSVPAVFTVSVDDGKSFSAEPVKKTVKGADGQQKNVTVDPSAYTQLRWAPKGKLPAGKVQTYRYRVSVK